MPVEATALNMSLVPRRPLCQVVFGGAAVGAGRLSQQDSSDLPLPLPLPPPPPVVAGRGLRRLIEFVFLVF